MFRRNQFLAVGVNCQVEEFQCRGAQQVLFFGAEHYGTDPFPTLVDDKSFPHFPYQVTVIGHRNPLPLLGFNVQVFQQRSWQNSMGGAGINHSQHPFHIATVGMADSNIYVENTHSIPPFWYKFR